VGIPRGTARLLLDEGRARPFAGAALELGRTAIFFRRDELARWAAAQRFALAPVAQPALSHDPRLAALGCMDDRTFFASLGFSRVDALDVSDWEKPELIWDLNRPVPAEWHGRYDLVIESGTLQHVFHLPNVLANLHALLKPGGRVVHGMAPSHNHVDHGFYMFSPTLFHDFYAANRWRIESEYWFEFEPHWYRSRFESPPWRIRRYTPGALDRHSYGGFGRRQVGLFVVATKTPEATADVVPQQSYYERFWSEEAAPRMDPASAGAPVAIDSLSERLLRAWKRARSFVVRRAPRRLPPPDLEY
jgi:SAM-dependent methyltransferase